MSFYGFGSPGGWSNGFFHIFTLVWYQWKISTIYILFFIVYRHWVNTRSSFTSSNLKKMEARGPPTTAHIGVLLLVAVCHSASCLLSASFSTWTRANSDVMDVICSTCRSRLRICSFFNKIFSWFSLKWMTNHSTTKHEKSLTQKKTDSSVRL